jgi:acyl carrier protein
MDKKEVAQRVRKVVAEMTRKDAAALKDDARFIQDLGMQSVQSLELIASFEDEFDIDMDEEKAGAVQTVGGAVDFIKKTVDEQKG